MGPKWPLCGQLNRLILLHVTRSKLPSAFEAQLSDSTGHSLQPRIAKLHQITIALEQAE